MNVIKYKLVEVGDIIVSIINRSNEDLSIYLNTALDTIIDYGNSIMPILNLDNIMEFHGDISSIYNILKNLNHIQASEFENHIEKSEEIMSEYLETRGQVIEYKIPVGEIIKSLRGDSPWEFKPLLLTHSYDEENDTMNSNLNNPPKQEKSIFDLISININIDDYFTFRQQEYLRAHTKVGMSAIYCIINDVELLNESLIWYISYLEFIGKELNYFKKNVINDMRLLYSMVKNIFNNKEGKSGLIIQSQCYGAAMYICAFTENILRITYKYIKQDEEYIASDTGTMGQYLTVNNEVIKEILGEHQIKHLMFYLGKTQKSNIGYNYRNKLAHWNGINREELTPELVCKLFFLMINIINSIFYYFYEKKRKEKVYN